MGHSDEQGRVVITGKTFKNERLTYRLELVADEAIAANDEIFVRETGLSIRELRVLRLIDDMPGTTFAEIAKSTGLERSLTSRIIQTLLKAGHIAREASTADARVFLLSTTGTGKEIREKSRHLSDRLEVILQDPLTEQERAALNHALERLGKWITSDQYHAKLNDI
ncbi:MAG: MarR family winged helix-turn-helix transcriptional regulator [Pikeienuella sp.]